MVRVVSTFILGFSFMSFVFSFNNLYRVLLPPSPFLSFTFLSCVISWDLGLDHQLARVSLSLFRFDLFRFNLSFCMGVMISWGRRWQRQRDPYKRKTKKPVIVCGWSIIKIHNLLGLVALLMALWWYGNLDDAAAAINGYKYTLTLHPNSSWIMNITLNHSGKTFRYWSFFFLFFFGNFWDGWWWWIY